MTLVWVLVCVFAFLGGRYFGQTEEWERVLDYLHDHEDDKPVWWVTGGIAADEHRKRPSLAVKMARFLVGATRD